MSESEPLVTHRNRLQTLSKRVAGGSARMSSEGTCVPAERQPVFRRHEPITGFDMERGNLRRNEKGNPQVAPTRMRENTDVRLRGGAARSSGEVPVTGVERRGCVIQLERGCQPPTVGGA